MLVKSITVVDFKLTRVRQFEYKGKNVVEIKLYTWIGANSLKQRARRTDPERTLGCRKSSEIDVLGNVFSQ